MNFEFVILDFLYSFHNPILDDIMVFITHLGDKGFLWIAVCLAMSFSKKYEKAGYAGLLSLLLMLIIGNITLKPLIARIRPYEFTHGINLLIPKPNDFSFPSGHSFASFSAATSIFCFHKKEGIASYVLAFLIAFSRLYLYVHFPSDVIAGIVLGAVIGIFSAKIVSKVKFFNF